MMTGRRYYLTTSTAWHRHASRCAETHFVVLESPRNRDAKSAGASAAEHHPEANSTLVFALITADEAAHIALESDPEAEPLPHPLARTPVSERIAQALAPYGVLSGDDTFTVAEKLASLNPLLRHRVF